MVHIEIITTTLDNGLTVISKSQQCNSVTISFLVKAGCFQETKDNLGIAHLVEHMLFKGTETRTSFQITNEIDSIGGVLNAETSTEHTRYYCTVCSDYWKTAFDILSDMLINNVIDDVELKKEKQVVIEELNSYADDPMSFTHELLIRRSNQNNINRQYIGGTTKSVAQISPKQIEEFKSTYYTANNIVLVATGNINHEELINEAKKIKFKYPNKSIPKQEFIPEKLGKIYTVEKPIIQSHLMLGFFGGIPKNDYHIMDVVEVLLGGNFSSRLYQKIREELGLSYTVSCDCMFFSDGSFFNIYAGLDNKNLKLALEKILQVVQEVKTSYISDEELDGVKKYIKGTHLISLESTSRQNSWLCKALLTNTAISSEEYIENIFNVSKDDIKTFLNKYFKKENICIVRLTNQQKV